MDAPRGGGAEVLNRGTVSVSADVEGYDGGLAVLLGENVTRRCKIMLMRPKAKVGRLSYMLTIPLW